MTIPSDDILEDLDLSRAEPGPGYLERLFFRFNERVPFETASKILRQATVGDRAARPRTADVFWADRLASGTGGTCFARVSAFAALLDDLGFRSRLALGRVREDFDHAALFVETPGGSVICDVGFPLPALIPARRGRVETGLGALAVEESSRGWHIAFEDGVPSGPREVEVFRDPVSDEAYQGRWEETFRPESKFLKDVIVHRLFENRRTTFLCGEIRIDDLHSRTQIPLAAPRSEALAEIFGIDAEVLDAAFEIAGDPEPEQAAASVEVYLESPTGADEAFAAISTPEGYRNLLEGVAEVATEATGPGFWTARLVSPAGPGGSPAAEIRESVEADPPARTLRIRRGSQETSYRAEKREGTPWLVRRGVLDGRRMDLLRNDSMRGRIAGSLAVDLLGWARRLG
ncbi:MAG: arylamine N-acetyltransferase [Acidobacteriota bacterium]|nr:arylamine N-acetyltransferase [Acidobacteriota bacterium]